MRAALCALQLGRMLFGTQQRAVCLERFSSQGLLEKQRKMDKHLSWHMCWAFSFVIWGCGGVGNGSVVERGCGWWVDAPEHCTCAVIYAASYVLVALISVIVNLSQVFSPMYVSHCTCGALSIALVVRCT